MSLWEGIFTLDNGSQGVDGPYFLPIPVAIEEDTAVIAGFL